MKSTRTQGVSLYRTQIDKSPRIHTVEPVWATTLPFHEKVVAVDRWLPLVVKIYSKNDVGAVKKSGREGRWSPLAGGRLYRVHCTPK